MNTTANTSVHPAAQNVPQLRLPGQAAAPEGPLDLSMMYLVHHAFRRDLDRFAAAIPVTPLEDRRAWQALAARWQRFSEVLHHHHTSEDHIVWPRLEERATPAERVHLDAMEAEHGEIDPLLESVTEGLAALAGETVPADGLDRRAALAVRIVATRDSLARHLAHEETEALPIVQRVLSVEEFDQVHKEIRASGKLPLGFMVPWLADGLPADDLEAILTQVGLPARVVLALSRRRFARAEREAFGYCR